MIEPENVRTKQEFLSFVYALRDAYRIDPVALQNDTVESFLGALGGWVEDMEGAYLNENQKIPEQIDWNVIARMLAAASIYD
jgi:hypothetical protein